MFVDTELLRCGADFSRSAGALAREGAERFSSVSLRSKVFGDFPEADQFRLTVAEAHEQHVASMQSHHKALESLAEKAQTAATTFSSQDELAGQALDETISSG
jgi:hypothetical protein